MTLFLDAYAPPAFLLTIIPPTSFGLMTRLEPSSIPSKPPEKLIIPSSSSLTTMANSPKAPFIKVASTTPVLFGVKVASQQEPLPRRSSRMLTLRLLSWTSLKLIIHNTNLMAKVFSLTSRASPLPRSACFTLSSATPAVSALVTGNTWPSATPKPLKI